MSLLDHLTLVLTDMLGWAGVRLFAVAVTVMAARAFTEGGQQ